MKLIYRKPAKRFGEALPIGNGKQAAMIYGGVRTERISVNDATLWSGYPRDDTNPAAAAALSEARRLVFDQAFRQADAFVKRRMGGGYSESYLPLCDVLIDFAGGCGGGYRRELDLRTATVEIETEGMKREAFASFDRQAIYYRIRFKTPTDFTVRARTKLRGSVETNGNELALFGHAPDRVVPNYVRAELRPVRYDEKKGMAFLTSARVETDGTLMKRRSKLCVEGAKEATIIIRTETGFCGFDRMPERDFAGCRDRIQARTSAGAVDFEAIRTAHIADFAAIFNRQKLDLYAEEREVGTLIDNAKRGLTDRNLINLLYDYGKYLIVSGSRGSEPLNLQGQWNERVRAPWSSNLTTNINFQMNYWAASGCDLEECLAPFYRSVAEIAVSGARTARVNFGARGFAANHNADLWRKTTPVKGNPAYMYAPLMGAWLAGEAYRHDRTLYGAARRETRGIVEQAARFVLDYLVERDGKLVICPSASPEAEFWDGKARCALGYASAFETGIVKETLKNAAVCTEDPALRAEIAAAERKLCGFTGTEGTLDEWSEGRRITDRGHRHFSPLYAVFPARIVTERAAPEVYQLSKRLFDTRFEYAHGSVGWSAAWGMCLAARFGDAERAFEYLKRFTERSLFLNLFGFHPPTYFQIDGNLGFTAGINEMLLREEDGVIEFLPACPKSMDRGKLTGHRICGATVSFEWIGGAVVRAAADRPVKASKLHLAENAALTNVTAV